MKIFSDGGVSMAAGTDATARPGSSPASPLHHEFEELARAGLPALRILQLTTLNAAQFLDTTDTMGTVEAGKLADLVLLHANPADDAANLHQVDAVVRDGRHDSTAALACLEDRVRSDHPAR